MLLELIDEAVTSGAPVGKACAVVGLAPTTIIRWRSRPESEDRRTGPNTRPRNGLSDEERANVVAVMNASFWMSIPPCLQARPSPPADVRIVHDEGTSASTSTDAQVAQAS
jgi:hypothetical protein